MLLGMVLLGFLTVSKNAFTDVYATIFGHVSSNVFAIPSPPSWASAIELGPLTIHVYAICILTGIAIAVYFGDKRFIARGGVKDFVLDTALCVIPVSIVGARLYHVLSNWNDFFPPNGDVFSIVKIWEGGIAIFGGVSFGLLAACVYVVKYRGMRLGPFADSVAPMIILAQAIGRIGNYFNQELFGKPTVLPWGLSIDPDRIPVGYEAGTLFHPTFLYELILNVLAFVILIAIDRKCKLFSGQLFALYMVFYGVIRFVLEFVRIDEAYVFFGLRLNAWTAVIVVVLGVVLFTYLGRRKADRVYCDSEREKFFERTVE